MLRSARRSYTAPARSLNYCVDLVRASDPERYACNLHAPAAARPGLFAFHALNVETARARSASSTEAIASGRLRWWRTTLEQAFGGSPPDHPVAQAVAHAAAAHGATRRLAERLIDAREADLLVKQPPTLAELTKYAEATAGSLLLLGLECVGATGEAAEMAAVHVGCAAALATMMRGTAAHAAEGCLYVPADVTSRHQVEIGRVMRGEPSQALADAVAEVADEAVAHLLAARSATADVPAPARAALLLAVPTDLHLGRLQRAGFSPFSPEMSQPLGLRMHAELLWRRATGRF